MSPLPHYLCRSCRSQVTAAMNTRSFTTSTPWLAIPPEAPNYVDVPLSLQPDLLLPRRKKGVLPVPREIFPPNQPDKGTENYIARATRDKMPKNIVSVAKMSELDEYKNRSAEMRKRHFREGLLELHHRKQTMTAQVAARSEQKRQERQRLIGQAEREDHRLTNVSTPKAMQPSKGNAVKDPNFKAIFAKKVANVQRKAAQKEEERRDALHTLYMNARAFITTEAQLNMEVERVFTDPNPAWQTAASQGTNIWNLGAPDTIADLLAESKTRTSKGWSKDDLGYAERKYKLDQQRMKRIAEELSGGKM